MTQLEKRKLVEIIEELAALLHLDGANKFRIAAMEKAARVLADFEGDLDVHAAEGRLTEIESIGKGMEEKILEYRERHAIAELDELRRRIPGGLLEMTRIPGFGAKKARTVWSELGIKSIDELEAACGDGRVEKLKGFGRKSTEKILEGIAHLRQFAGRFRVDQAMAPAREVLGRLRGNASVIHAEVAGSLRRCRETVKDIDVVCSSENPAAVMDFFTTLPEVNSVDQKGDTKSSVHLAGGIQCDLRVVSMAEYPYALLHFTGSKEHNTRLRSRAKELGLKLNEYGLFPDGSDVSLSAESEAEIYEHLRLPYIIPELREDRGEIEAAEKGRLPEVVDWEHIRGIAHMHTHYSDGKPRLEEYSAWAADRGISWMGIADHSKSLGVARGLSEERVLEQHREIDEVNASWKKKKIRLLKGIECDIMQDGSLDYDDEFRGCFEFIVASVHTYFNLTEAEQTKRICRALAHPHTTILGHMTGRLLLAREGYACDQRAIIAEAARHRVAIEINANPWRLDVDWRLLGYALEQGCKISIGPDAHVMAGLEDMEHGIGQARKGWVEPKDLVNSMTAEEFLDFANKR